MQNVIAILRAAGEETRLRLLAVLARSELTVTELTQVLGQSQPRVSRHLKLLCEAGLVDRVPEGSWVLYRLADSRGQARIAAGIGLLEAIIAALPGDDPVLQRDLERLNAVRRARADAAADAMRRVSDERGRIGSLHLPEERIESAMCELAGEGPFEFMVDLGTGTGRILELLGPRADLAEGVDLSRDMLNLARANLDRAGLRNCRVRQGDILALPFASGAADLVTLHQVLHFLPDPAAAVAEAARLLRRNGRLLVVDFAPHNHEVLREEYAHRRLGFADSEVRGWFKANGIAYSGMRRLPENGDAPLTVCVWLGVQSRAVAEPPLMADVAE
jgi:DNA-binding transcriptional ArsR family regulator/protein-L-isoaspartate O-methyltransferase